MEIYIFSKHLGLDGIQVACRPEIVGVHTYVPRSYVKKL